MADIQVRIKLNAGVDGDQINSVAFNQETNNVSKAVGSKTTKNDGQNLISWGNVVKDSNGNIVSKVVNGEVVTTGLLSLADGYVGGANSTLSSQGGYNGFVFGVVPENKMYSVEITLEGSNIDSVTFYGDKNANQFPTRAIVNGEYIYSDDAEWTIVFPSVSNTQTITFDMWNRDNYNACFTHIGIFVNELVLDKSSIRDVESLSQSTGQPKDIYYGLTPNSGRIDILDVNGEIIDYINDGIFPPDNVSISIYANNKCVQNHLSSIDKYDNESKIISSSLVSNMENKYDVKHKIFPQVVKNQTIEDILFQIFRFQLNYSNDEYFSLYQDENGNDRMTFFYKDVQELTIYDYLSSINIGYFIPYEKTYRELITELLSLAQMQLIETDDGKYKIISARPRLLSNEKIIYVPKRQQFSNLQYDIITRNKYTNVQAGVTNISYSTDVAYEKSFSIVDDGGSITVSNINDTAQIKTIGGNVCICFFLDVKSEKPIYDFTNTYSHTGFYSYEIEVIGDNDKYIKRETKYWYDTNSTKEDYDFSNSEFEVVVLDKYTTLENHSFAISINTSIISSPKSVRIKLMANQYDYQKETTNFNDNNSNILIYPNSDYMTKQTQINIYGIVHDYEIFSHISDSIIKDYANGIRTANVSIGCLDYFYEDGSQAKKWADGDIIQVGDVVRVEGNNRIWRVTGRNFRKSGVPMIDLQLQELIT